MTLQNRNDHLLDGLKLAVDLLDNFDGYYEAEREKLVLIIEAEAVERGEE